MTNEELKELLDAMRHGPPGQSAESEETRRFRPFPFRDRPRLSPKDAEYGASLSRASAELLADGLSRLCTAQVMVRGNAPELEFAERLLQSGQSLEGGAVRVTGRPPRVAFVSLSIAMPLVVKSLGARTTGDRPRDVTAIEREVVQSIVHCAVSSCDRALYPANPPKVEKTIPTQDLRITSETLLVVWQFDVRSEDSVGYFLVGMDPSELSVQRARAGAEGSGQADGEKPPPRALAKSGELLNVPVRLDAETRPSRIPMGEILNLQPGDVIDLGRDGLDTLLVRVAGVPRYRSTLSEERGRRRVQLTSEDTRP